MIEDLAKHPIGPNLYAHSGYLVETRDHIGEYTVPPQLYGDHIQNVYHRSLEYFDKAFIHHKNRQLTMMYRRSLEIAAEWHDFGKVMPECQKVLSQSIKTDESILNHVDAGVAYCVVQYKITSKPHYLLAGWLILAHHIGFLDWEELVKTVNSNSKQMLAPNVIILTEKWRDHRIKKYVDYNLNQWIILHQKAVQIINLESNTEYDTTIDDVDWFDVLMIFSCLVSADHEDTNQHFNQQHRPLLPPAKLRVDERLARLEKYVQSLSNGKIDERTRNRMCLYEAAGMDTSSPWVSNDGPVGTGKTNANHRKALLLAKKYGCERIISVVPFTNVIHQLVDKAKESLRLPGEFSVGVINELHSKVQFKDWWLRKYNNRWDGPLTYTTCVQYFESLATYHPTSVKKLVYFTNSVVILDEYQQSMPYEFWSHALTLLEKLVKNYNVHIIFSSGTPIDFWDIYHKNIHVENMISKKDWKRLQSAEKRRIKYVHLQTMGLKRLVKHIKNGYKTKHSTLLVYNTTNNASLMYQLLKENLGENVYHLSSRLIPVDRENILKIVSERLKNGLPTVLAATSTVECGIDISFERIYREETSLDSLLQCSGRCNRNNEYKYGKVYVFRFSNSLVDQKIITINPMNKRVIDVFRQLDKGDWNSMQGTSAVQDSLSRNDRNTVSEIEENYLKGNIRTIGKKFRLIQTNVRTIVVTPSVIQRIKDKDITLYYGDITRNSVTVFENVFNKLLEKGALEPLEKEDKDEEEQDRDPVMWALLGFEKNYSSESGILID